MIRAIADWLFECAARSQIREADRLEVEADMLRVRAAMLRERAALNRTATST